MSEERKELKPCPACESPGEQDSGKAWAKCTKPNCYNHLRWMPKKVWNSRPAEERLEAEINSRVLHAISEARRLVDAHAEIKRLEAALRMALSPMTPEELEEYAQPGCTGGKMSEPEILFAGWVCANPECGTVYAEYVNGCPRCWENGEQSFAVGMRVAEIRGWGAGFSQTKIAEAIVAAPDLLAEAKELKEKLGQARGQTIDAFTGPFVDGLGRRRMAYLSHYFLPSPEHPDWCQNCGCNQLDPLHLQLNETRSERIEKFKAATPQGAICP